MTTSQPPPFSSPRRTSAPPRPFAPPRSSSPRGRGPPTPTLLPAQPDSSREPSTDRATRRTRGLLLSLLLALLTFGLLQGCASDCDVACGKLEFCNQLPGVSRSLCIDRCEERKPENGRKTEDCANCLGGVSCSSIRRGTCFPECTDVVGPRVEGVGGEGGGAAGEGGAGGAGGLGE